MITYYYKNNGGKLETVNSPVKGSWIHAINPSAQELECLQGLGIPHDYLMYPLDLDERSRTEREDGDILIILRVPYYQGEVSDIPYSTIPLGIILTPQYLVTVCKLDNELMEDITSGRVKDMSTTKQNRFILRMLLQTASKYLTNLRSIQREIDLLEDKLQASTRNKEVLELLRYQKSLTYFTTALKSNELMLERLQRSQLFRMYPEDEDLLEDVITENQQAIEMTNIAGNILSQMMDAFASIISNNLNVIMKFLAAMTIVLSLPTMIASFYGMNVKLPLMQHELAFVMIVAISVLTALVVSYLFIKKDWF